ncbi:MAG TPA: hypothetical protein VGM39_06290 [Kofleriaceae bacterium]
MHLAIAIAFLSACGVSSPALDARDPASPKAPVGRIAPAPAATRAGAASYPDVPPRTAPAPMDHSHHHHGGQ